MVILSFAIGITKHIWYNGDKMRVNRTYSLDYQTVLDLNSQISAKHRSRFVDKAINHRLNGCDNTRLSDISTRRMLAGLASRDDISQELLALINLELKK